MGDTRLDLWLFAPVDDTGVRRPAIVFFFGGGWKGGSPRQFDPQCRHLAGRGMVAITADYRVESRQHAKPVDCVADARSAVRWVRGAGNRCELIGYDDQHHGFFNREPWRTRTLEDATTLLDSLGWLAGECQNLAPSRSNAYRRRHAHEAPEETARMDLLDGLAALSAGQILLLLGALVIAFGFEVINGFHDTANAVATVIYTKSLKPTPAVVWSGIWNFIGVHAGGIGVAFSIIHLLPVDLLVNIQTGRGLAMVLELLLAAITWNFPTWHRGPSVEAGGVRAGVGEVGRGTVPRPGHDVGPPVRHPGRHRRDIALAWILTLPVTMLLAGILYAAATCVAA